MCPASVSGRDNGPVAPDAGPAGGAQPRAGTVVVVEDDPNIADLVDMYLRREGFRVLQAADGRAGLAAIEREHPRLVILDVGLPGEVDGLEVCRRLRATSHVPVVMLTARDGEVDRVLGLELGADDYVTKPFSPRELVARVKAVLRRVDTNLSGAVLQVGELAVDLGRPEARVGDEPLVLTAKEIEHPMH